MAVLSKRQLNALRILKERITDAKLLYCESLEVFIRLYNSEPPKEPFDKWSLWRAKFKLARDDMRKMFSKFNLAVNHYDNYRKVAFGL